MIQEQFSESMKKLFLFFYGWSDAADFRFTQRGRSSLGLLEKMEKDWSAVGSKQKAEEIRIEKEKDRISHKKMYILLIRQWRICQKLTMLYWLRVYSMW